MNCLAASEKRSPGWFKTFRRGVLFIFSLSIVLACVSRAAAQLITNAAAVLDLPGEEALKRLPIHVRGVVTLSEPTWGGRFFIQDETSGVFVENLTQPRPEVGDVLDLAGVSHPGAFAPIISGPRWTKVGTAALPAACPVPIEQIMSGSQDGQRVEIVGIVRAFTPGTTNYDLYIASGGYRLHAFPKTESITDPQNLIGARVRIKGTAAASFNRYLRHLVSVVLFVPLVSDFTVEKTEPMDPFEESTLPLNGIAQYRKDFVPGKRVHVKGVVTLQRLGEDLFLQDNTGGLHVKSRQLQAFAVGDVIEAVGFPDFENFLPVLEDAVFKTTGEPSAPAWPKDVSIPDIVEQGLHHADLIKLQGKLIDRTVQQRSRRASTTPATNTVLLLQNENLRFTAQAESSEISAAVADIPLGSVLEVSGVCFTESGEDKKLRSLQILLPDANSVRVRQKPSWWTPQRLLMGLGAVLVVLAVAVSWIVMISKRNRVLNQLVQEKEKAQTELQVAHDELEERVKERTAQLKFQITARKESEVQFKAVLAERTRLAQEIHDTLEQTLMGIALQLDITSKQFKPEPEKAKHHLELASDLVAQSQADVRRSVWDLRSRALEQFDLPGALVTSGKQLIDGTNIHFEVNAKGRVRPLPETVEENLLRIAQEALTNVIKHSEATRAEIELDYGPQTVSMQIKDNGRGFQSEKRVGPSEGHFGLLGISERAKRLGTDAIFESTPGGGTTLRVRVAIDQEFPELKEFESAEKNLA